MSGAKAAVMNNLQKVPDNITDEIEVINRLYVLARLEHSRKRCDEEGVYSDEDVDAHFLKKRESYAS